MYRQTSLTALIYPIENDTWGVMGLEKSVSVTGPSFADVKGLFLNEVSRLLEEDRKKNRPYLYLFAPAPREFFNALVYVDKGESPELPVWMPPEFPLCREFIYVRFLSIAIPVKSV